MQLLKVKWENIITIGLAIFFIVVDTMAFVKDGFDFNVFMCELVLNLALLFATHYIIKNARLNWQ